MTHSEQSSANKTGAMAETVASVGRSKFWRIAFGVLTLVIGLTVLIWPKPTILVLAVLFGVQLFIAGAFWLVAAFGMDDVSGGGRVLMVVLAILTILIGILCLRAPFQTVQVLTLLLGITWVVGGVIEVFSGVGGASGWAIFSGLVSIALGVVVLVWPDVTVVAMAWLVGLLLTVYGLMAIVVAIAGGGASTEPRVSSASYQMPGRPATS